MTNPHSEPQSAPDDIYGGLSPVVRDALLAATNPAWISRWRTWLAADPAAPNAEMAARELFAAVDASVWPLADWCRALDLIAAHCAARNVAPPWHRMLGYLECTTSATGNAAWGIDLTELTAGMLESFGFATQ
jgi:hypothetical protein